MCMTTLLSGPGRGPRARQPPERTGCPADRGESVSAISTSLAPARQGESRRQDRVAWPLASARSRSRCYGPSVATLLRQDIAALERIEVAACRSWAAAAPLQVARDLGIGLRPIGSGLAIRASKIDILAYNRVLGLGVDEPARSAELDEAIEFFR